MRLDQELVSRGLFASREKARRAVMAGIVLVEGHQVDKPGSSVAPAMEISLVDKGEPYVSRAGRKLEAALDHFLVDPRGKVCVDVGASTGGFTDCLLQRGAARVFAIDVGYGQLDYGLRRDARVVVMERVNARHLVTDSLPEKCDLATVDVSFISLLKVVPSILGLLREGARVITLVKPQFEAPRGSLGKGGILRDEELRAEVIAQRVDQLTRLGLVCEGVIDSPVVGAGGNREALASFTLAVPSSGGVE